MKNNVILVKDIPINVTNFNNEDYICISDIANAKIGSSNTKDVIRIGTERLMFYHFCLK